MDVSKTFVVSVERATPACGSNCPNLEIIADGQAFRGEDLEGTIEHTNWNRKCINECYCKHLWDTMKEQLRSD